MSKSADAYLDEQEREQRGQNHGLVDVNNELREACKRLEFAIQEGRKDVSGIAGERLKESVFDCIESRWNGLKALLEARESDGCVVSVDKGDRGQVYDATGQLIPRCREANLKTGRCVVRQEYGTASLVRSFPAPLRFEPSPGRETCSAKRTKAAPHTRASTEAGLPAAQCSGEALRCRVDQGEAGTAAADGG